MNEIQDLLQKRLIETGHVEHAALFRRQDSSLRVASLGLSLTPEEIAYLVSLFDDLPACREEGVVYADNTYLTMRADKYSIYSVYEGAGVVLVRTKTLIVFATWSSSQLASVCIESAENIGSYFKEKGK